MREIPQSDFKKKLKNLLTSKRICGIMIKVTRERQVSQPTT